MKRLKARDFRWTSPKGDKVTISVTRSSRAPQQWYLRYYVNDEAVERTLPLGGHVGLYGPDPEDYNRAVAVAREAIKRLKTGKMRVNPTRRKTVARKKSKKKSKGKKRRNARGRISPWWSVAGIAAVGIYTMRAAGRAVEDLQASLDSSPRAEY